MHACTINRLICGMCGTNGVLCRRTGYACMLVHQLSSVLFLPRHADGSPCACVSSHMGGIGLGSAAVWGCRGVAVRHVEGLGTHTVRTN